MPETTVAAIITAIEDDLLKILLTRRNRKLRRFGGQWCLPGGHIDQGETARAAIIREVLAAFALNQTGPNREAVVS